MRLGSFGRCGCGDSAAEVVPHLKREWGKLQKTIHNFFFLIILDKSKSKDLAIKKETHWYIYIYI